MKHEWYAWGPYLAKFKVENKLIKELNKRAKTLTKDARFTLAGHLDNEKFYEDKDKEWFMETFKPYFQSYLEESVKRQSLAKPINKVKLILRIPSNHIRTVFIRKVNSYDHFSQ